MRGIFVSFLVCIFILGACGINSDFKFSKNFAARHTFGSITFKIKDNIRKNVNGNWEPPTVTFGDMRGILNDDRDAVYVGPQIWRSMNEQGQLREVNRGWQKQWAIKTLLVAKVRADRT